MVNVSEGYKGVCCYLLANFLKYKVGGKEYTKGQIPRLDNFCLFWNSGRILICPWNLEKRIVFLWHAGPSILLRTRIKIKTRYDVNNSKQCPGAWNWHSLSCKYYIQNIVLRWAFPISRSELSFLEKMDTVIWGTKWEHQGLNKCAFMVVGSGGLGGRNEAVQISPFIFCLSSFSCH